MELSFRTKIFSSIENPIQKEVLMLTLVSTAILIFMGLFVIRPAVSSAIEQVSTNRVKVELIQKQTIKLDNFDYLTGELADYEYETRILDKALSGVYDTESFVMSFNDYFEYESGIDLVSMEFKKSVFSRNGLVVDLVEGYYPVSFTVKFRADYNGIVSIIEYIELFPRILNIKNINFIPVQGDLPISGKIDMEVMIKKEIIFNDLEII